MWTEPILHVDMDSFFVEVERRENPHLRGRPVAVGGTGGRGVIASASYEARRFGVHSAQPTGIALRLCPQLVVVSPSHGRYGDVSANVFAVFRSITPLVEGLSLDEAFLDIRGLRNHYGSPSDVGEEVRNRIREELGLPASVGVAGSKFVAKLASEAAKPDGLLHVPLATQDDFLRPLPVEALWGVGPAALAGLQRLGVATVGDLAEIPADSLSRVLGPTQAAHLLSLANGIDNREVEPVSASKSISVEETFPSDLSARDLIESTIMALAQKLSARLRQAGVEARTFTLKVRFADFETITRSRTLTPGTNHSREIYRLGLGLFSNTPEDRPIRLLGLGGSGFDTFEGGQLLLETDEAWQRVGEAVAEVQDKFGTKSIEPARLVGYSVLPEPGEEDEESSSPETKKLDN